MSQPDDPTSQAEKGQVATGQDPSADDQAQIYDPAPRPTISSRLRAVRSLPSSLNIRRGSSQREAQEPRKPAKVQLLEGYPLGYPRLSCFLDSEDAFMVYRRFGVLHSRVLLYKQEELRRLEDLLQDLDLLDDRDDKGRLYLASWRRDTKRPAPSSTPGQPGPRPGTPQLRKDLIKEIEAKLIEYGQFMSQAQRFASMKKPTKRDHLSVLNYMEYENMLVEIEGEFIYMKDDLVTLGNTEDAWLDGKVSEAIAKYFSKPFRRMFQSEERMQKSQNSVIHYVLKERISMFVTMLVSLYIFLLLVGSISILYYLTHGTQGSYNGPLSIFVLLGSTITFGIVLAVFTTAKRHEVLAASAAYGAVVVVFVGNFGSSN